MMINFVTKLTDFPHIVTGVAGCIPCRSAPAYC